MPEIPPEEVPLEEACPAQLLLDAVDAALVALKGLGVAEVTRGAVPAHFICEPYEVCDLRSLVRVAKFSTDMP